VKFSRHRSAVAWRAAKTSSYQPAAGQAGQAPGAHSARAAAPARRVRRERSWGAGVTEAHAYIVHTCLHTYIHTARHLHGGLCIATCERTCLLPTSVPPLTHSRAGFFSRRVRGRERRRACRAGPPAGSGGRFADSQRPEHQQFARNHCSAPRAHHGRRARLESASFSPARLRGSPARERPGRNQIARLPPYGGSVRHFDKRPGFCPAGCKGGPARRWP
jgi:hypothetical protein